MELVYLWVEEYKNIKQQGFNFSPRFECEFKAEYEKDENGKEKLKDDCELVIKPKEYFENFFGDNINVTAIVGENGSGKSSLIEGALPFYGPKLGVTYYNNILSIHSSHEIKIVNKTKINYSSNKGSLREEKITLKNFSWDILKYEKLDGLAAYFHVDPNILTTLFNTFHEPDYLNLYSYHKLFILKLADVYIKYQPKNFEYVPKKINIKFHAQKDKDKWDFDKIYSQIDELRFYSKKEEKEDKEKEIEWKKKESKKTVKKYLEKYFSNLESEQEFTLKEFQALLNEYELIDELFSKLDSFSLEVYDEKNVKLYDLSHGERSRLLSNLLIYESIMESDKEDILFLLDEPDITLHPQWQKQYIHQLIHTFEKVGKKIHFIITSHSPFILSDLPKENVIFLENGKQVDPKIKTFGANIHTLLSHGFFMKDGLMGEFAKGKINEVIENLQNRSQSLFQKQIKSIIATIGEPFLQVKLEQMYNEKFGLDDELEELQKQQEQINLKIEQLKKQKSDNVES